MSNSKAVQQWREETKRKLVKGFGGCCNRCGYNKCIKALELHHIDPKLKEHTIGSILSSPKKWQTIASEAAKCMLLCSNCHKEFHAGMWTLAEVEVNRFVPKEFPMQERQSTGTCPMCGVTVYGTVTCSLNCAAKKRIKAQWPAHTELLALLKTHSKCQVAEMLGVSEAAVRKRLKKFPTSTMVVQDAVNIEVPGSSPGSGAVYESRWEYIC